MHSLPSFTYSIDSRTVNSCTRLDWTHEPIGKAASLIRLSNSSSSCPVFLLSPFLWLYYHLLLWLWVILSPSPISSCLNFSFSSPYFYLLNRTNPFSFHSLVSLLGSSLFLNCKHSTPYEFSFTQSLLPFRNSVNSILLNFVFFLFLLIDSWTVKEEERWILLSLLSLFYEVNRIGVFFHEVCLLLLSEQRLYSRWIR